LTVTLWSHHIYLLLPDEFISDISGGDVLTGPYQVKQCAGRNIQITCRYHSFYRNNVKYWCKGYYFNHCSILIRTNQPLHVSGPLEITDNKNEGFFSIHMKSIKSENSGWYWCAIERVSRHVSFAVDVIVYHSYVFLFREINFTQTPVHKIWSIIRWFIFLGLCLIVFCFTMYTELS
uniref:Immunoglobulin V-set domain-containing protein n=1 Tax=Electrophorus electricus TaxID=8005 RepID=A0A4W4HHS0_ELEEL